MHFETRKSKPRIGLLITGHKIYWDQFPNLKEMGTKMCDKLLLKLNAFGEVIRPELVDTIQAAEKAATIFNNEKIDILLIYPMGYTTGMMIVPVIRASNVPIRIINAHEDSSYDYNNADTALYLHHEGPCCIPEYSGTLVSLGIKFQIISGHFNDQEMWCKIKRDCIGAAAAREFNTLNFGVIGNTYTNMTDMPIDEHKLLKATGKMLQRPEIEEITEAYKHVTDEQLNEMYVQFREYYKVDETVTNEHMKESAKLAVAYDQIIKKYDISAFGYYWWGVKSEITEMRAQSALAVSRLTAQGRPGVTEGDVKTAMAMKMLDLMGGGGMFLEFFFCDYDNDFIMVGHDGPSNISIAKDKPKLQHLKIHHGKTGDGLGIDFEVIGGPCTLVNLTQFGTDAPFKLIYTVGEVLSGDILNIGNPNCRIKVNKSISQFFNDWCQQGPEHHMALGIGDLSREIKIFAEKMGFDCVEV